MLSPPVVALSTKAERQLARWQAEVDALPTHADRVAAAKRAFKARNTARNATFGQVRASLDLMCPANRRCGYCEDSVADEVEHIAPKRHFPELTFVWPNYLYSCGPCNGPKNDRFAVLDAIGNVIELASRGPPTPPSTGRPLLIDPRREDPLPLLELDLSGTFYIVPAPGLASFDHLRAGWTIRTLGLNRTYLVGGRRSAFGAYRALIAEYAAERDAQASRASLDALRTGLLAMPHPTVFREMQRQAPRDPRIAAAFASTPEALTW